MAQKSRKYSCNTIGKFYVDNKCIACDTCVGIAYNFFAMNDNNGHAYVFRQPKNKDEIELCNEALLVCPVSAIGDDG